MLIDWLVEIRQGIFAQPYDKYMVTFIWHS